MNQVVLITNSFKRAAHTNFLFTFIGACRGEGWSNEPWPLTRGRKTLEECYEVCKNRKGCTSFELGPPKKKDKYQCILYGHEDVDVANSLSLKDRKCFRIPGT